MASVDSVAAPSCASASSAVDLPDPMPPVRPMKGTTVPPAPARWLGRPVRRRLFGRGRLGRGLAVGRLRWLGGTGLGGRLGAGVALGRRRRDVVAGEDILGELELGNVVEVPGALAVGRGALLGLELAQRQVLALDALDGQGEPAPLGVDLEDPDLDLVALLHA